MDLKKNRQVISNNVLVREKFKSIRSNVFSIDKSKPFYNK